MKGITDPLLEIKEYRSLLDSLKQNSKPINVTGPSDSQKAHLVFSVCEHLGNRALYIAQNEIQARKAYEDFTFFLGDDVLLFPSKEIIMHDIKAKSNQEVFARLNTLLGIHLKHFRVIVASAESVMHKLMLPDMYRQSLIYLTGGTRVNLTALSKKLVEIGYERADVVESTGQFAVRGGIIDIYPPNYDYALRVELFDDEVDSIRRFDPESQRSVERMEEAVVTPSREIIYTHEMKSEIIDKMQKSLEEYGKRTGGLKLSERINADIDRIRFEHYFPGIDRYLPFIMETAASVMDYLDDETVVFIDESRRVRKRMEDVCLEHMETCKMLMEKEQILPESCGIYFDYTDFTKKLDLKRIVFLNSLAADDASPIRQHENIHLLSKAAGIYRGHIEMLARDLKEWKHMKNRVVILLSSAGMRAGLMDYLKDDDLSADLSDSIPDSIQPGQVLICAGSLENGFEYPSIGLVVLTDKEVYAPERKLGKKKASKRTGRKISLFTDLNLGDYVVHQSRGRTIWRTLYKQMPVLIRETAGGPFLIPKVR
jgi:transcription-repair coupling factor (superfamily II helicase)